jgi:glucan-binding YG repeat protein
VTSGRRDKQIQVYDPAIAGKQAVAQKDAGPADKNVGNKNAGQNVPAGQKAFSAGAGWSTSAARCQQQGAGHVVHQQGKGQPRHRDDDGNSALVRTRYQQQYQPSQHYQQDQQNEQHQPEQQQEKMIAGPIAS